MPAALAAQHKPSKMCNFRDILMVNNMRRKLQETCRAVRERLLHICWLRAKVAATACNVPHATASQLHAQDKQPGSRMYSHKNQRAASGKPNVFIKCNQEMHVIRIPSYTHTYTNTHTDTLRSWNAGIAHRNRACLPRVCGCAAHMCVCACVLVCASVIYGSTLCLKRISLKWKAPLPSAPCHTPRPCCQPYMYRRMSAYVCVWVYVYVCSFFLFLFSLLLLPTHTHTAGCFSAS